MSVASLGWVTPGAATEGVTPLFFPQKPGDLFRFFSSPVLRCHPCLLSPEKLKTIFICFTQQRHFLLISLGCHPPGGCHPAFFVPVRPRFVHYSLQICPQIFSYGCHPLEGVTRGGPPPPSDATGSCNLSPMHVTVSAGACDGKPTQQGQHQDRLRVRLPCQHPITGL